MMRNDTDRAAEQAEPAASPGGTSPDVRGPGDGGLDAEELRDLIIAVAREMPAAGMVDFAPLVARLAHVVNAGAVTLLEIVEARSLHRVAARVHTWSADGPTLREMEWSAEEMPWLRARMPLCDPLVLDATTAGAGALARLAGQASLHARSAVLAPVLGEGRLLGAMAITGEWARASWTGHLLSLLRLLADLVAVGLLRRSSPVRTAGVMLVGEGEPAIPPAVTGPCAAVLHGTSAPLVEMMQFIDRAAATDLPVFLVGELGVGKRDVARAIHARSRRAGRPAVFFSCAGLSRHEIEEELFGGSPGLPGSPPPDRGGVVRARGSTLFIDEIGDLPVDLQARLLDLLEDAGDESADPARPDRPGVRLVLATKRALEAEFASGRMRRDLVYRLNPFQIRVPALRDRREDIAAVARAMARDLARRMDHPFEDFTPGALAWLREQPWPGNALELATVVQRALVLCPQARVAIELDAAAPGGRDPGAAPAPPPSIDRSLRATERRHIAEVLEDCGWRVRGRGGAAEVLGLPPSTLETRMIRLGIRRPGR